MCKYIHVEILSKVLENGIQPHGGVKYIIQNGCHFKHNSQVSKCIPQYYQSRKSLIIVSAEFMDSRFNHSRSLQWTE